MPSLGGSWREDAVSSVTEFQAVAKSLSVEIDPDNISWRGLGREEWTLRSTLDRYIRDRVAAPSREMALRREHEMLNAFVHQVFPAVDLDELPAPIPVLHESIWQRMAMARHAGLPTRIVDWTSSWLVAAYFTSSTERDCVGAIWWYARSDLYRKLRPLWLTWNVRTRAQLLRVPEGVDEDLIRLYNLDQRVLHESAFQQDEPPPWLSEVTYHIAPSDRLLKQQGHMTAAASVLRDHNELMDAIDDAKEGDGPIRRGRILISPAAKREIRARLSEYGLTAERLGFPTLMDDAAREISAQPWP